MLIMFRTGGGMYFNAPSPIYDYELLLNFIYICKIIKFITKSIIHVLEIKTYP